MKHLFSAAAILFAIAFTSCSKEAELSNNINAAVGANTFVWVNGTDSLRCDSAYASANFKTIFAYKGSGANRYFFEINLTSLAVGQYSFVAPTSNAFAYIRPSSANTLIGFAGALQISANANNTITGVGVASVAQERVNFVFSALPIR
jgi:hypothetical protein